MRPPLPEDDRAFDALVRDALAADVADSSALRRLVRQRIARERTRRRLLAAASAAALLAMAGLAFMVPRAYQQAQLFREVARDHRLEVVEHQPRRWRSAVSEVAALMAKNGVPEDIAAALSPAGYVFQEAKTCRIEGQAVLHLVYRKGAQEVSVFVRKRGGGRLGETSTTVGQEHIAFLRRARFEEFVVTDLSTAECLKLARFAANAL